MILIRSHWLRNFSRIVALFLALPLWAAGLKVSDLQCEYRTNPLGIDSPQPRLFWTLTSSQRGQTQTAYQILAASTPERLAKDQGDLWDSGQVRSDQSIQIPYAGRELKSSQAVYWKVRAWDRAGIPSAWSSPASWTMGVLGEGEWGARWIGATAEKPVIAQLIGYHTATAPRDDELKWVQVDLGRTLPISTVRLVPMKHAGKAGFGFPLRFKIEAANDPDFQKPTLIADHLGADFPSPGAEPVVFPAKNCQGRFVRVTVTKLWRRDEVFCAALRRLDVMSEGRNVAVHANVTAKDSVEGYGWGKAGLTQGSTADSAAAQPQTLLLRREFTVQPKLKRALVHLCGLGCFELSLNGRKVGDDLFPPGWTKYDKTCLYETYDVTALLRKGPNALGLLLANGMYNVVGGRYTKFRGTFGSLKAIAQLRLEYDDATTTIIGTDDQWRWAPGPITFSCVYGGEDYDARLEPRGWNQAGFNDASWASAKILEGPGGRLRGLSCEAPPVRAFDLLKPVRVSSPQPGVTVYDLGQNAALVPRLSVKGSAGAVVKIIPAELVGTNGLADRVSCGRGSAYWQYTLAGNGAETWFPKFYYHGCRYLQVECAAPAGGELPVVKSLEGIVVQAAAAPVGEFACSNPLFNRIRTLVRWAQRSNMMSVMTDCPHREKLGWLEEDHLNGPSLRYEFELAPLLTKVMNDMADSQHEDGLVPDIAPEYVQFSGGFVDSPEWGSAFILVPWQQYEFNGDLELLRRYYDAMKRYVAYLGAKASHGIVSHGLGDWYDIGPKRPGVAQLTPVPLTATAFYYYDVWILSQAAALLGKAEDARQYADLAHQIRAAFNQEFFNPATGQYATGSQCANAIALVMNLVEPDRRQGALDGLVQDIRARGNALTAGDVGYRYLLCALAQGGRSDVIFDINNQSEKPGYGYQLQHGATSLTEAWDAGRGSSQNHFMLGQIMEWFYHDLAGIACDPAGPGFKKIQIKPAPVGDVTWVNAAYRSLHGPIRCAWKRDARRFTLNLSVPANTTATVWLPAASCDTVTESGRSAARSEGVRFLRQEKDRALFEIGSGSYRFVSRLSLTPP